MELQTHWLGNTDSAMGVYRLGERVPGLRGIEAATIPEEHWFVGRCQCGALFRVPGRVKDEAVIALGEPSVRGSWQK